MLIRKRKSARRALITAGCCVGILALASPTRAADFTWSFSSGALSANAVFHDAGGGTLQITLTNSGGDVLVPADLLTALFFNCACGTLTPVSATLAGGSTVLFGSNGDGNVGGEWAYAAGVSGPGGATRGISAVGFGLFGSPNFDGPDLDGHASLGGMDYGVASSGDDPTTGNTPVTGTNPLIKNSVTFTFDGFNGNPSFSNISFQYGTSLNEPNSGGGTGAGTGIGSGSGGGSGQTLVPEPASLLLFGSGLSVVAYAAGRKRQNRKRKR